MNIKEHICETSRACVCSLVATEPNEECPKHGAGEWPPRCAECGRFMTQILAPEKPESPQPPSEGPHTCPPGGKL
jgi:hypothetical protein